MDTKLSEIHAIILMRAVCEDPVAMDRWELVMEHLLKPVQKFMMKRITDIEIQVLETLKIWISADVKGGATLRKLCAVFRTESLLALAGRLETDHGAMFVEDPEKVGHVEAKQSSRDIYPNLPQSIKSDPYPTLELVGSVRNFVDFSLIPSTQFNYLTEILLSYVYIGHPDRFLDNLSNCKYLRKIHMDKIGCTYFTVNKSIYLPELKHFYLNVLGFTASSTPEYNVISTLNLKPFIFFRTKPQVFKNFGDFLKLGVRIKVSLDDTVIFHSKWSKAKSLTFDYEPNTAQLEFVSHTLTHLVIQNCNMSYFFPEKLEKNKILESIRLENVCLDSGQFLPECKTVLPNLKEFYANFTLKSTDSISDFDLAGILFFINKADAEAEGHYVTTLRDLGVKATVIGAGRNLIDPDMSKETALTFSYEPSSSQLLSYSKNLKELTITNCELSDSFPSHLKPCVNLEVIRLIDISIPDEQFHYFNSVVLPNLRIFYISQVNRGSKLDDDWYRYYLVFLKISDNDWKPENFLDTGITATVIVNGQTLFDSNWYDRAMHALTLDFEPSGPLSKSIRYFSKELIQLNFKNCTLQSKFVAKLKRYCQKLEVIQFDDVDLEGQLLEGVEWSDLPPLLKQISLNTNVPETAHAHFVENLREKHPIFFTKLGFDFKMMKKVEFLLKLNGNVWKGTGNQLIAKIEPPLNDEGLRNINQLILYKCTLSPDFPKKLANCELLEDIRLTQVKLTDDIFNSRVTLPRLKSFHFHSPGPIYFKSGQVDIHQICFFDKNGSWNISQAWEQNVNIYIFFRSSPGEVHFEIVHESREIRIQGLPQCPDILTGCTNQILDLPSKVYVICSPICDFPSATMFTSAVTTLTLYKAENPDIAKFFYFGLVGFQNLKEILMDNMSGNGSYRYPLNMNVFIYFRQLKKLILSNFNWKYSEPTDVLKQNKYITCETLVMQKCSLHDNSLPENFPALFRELKFFELDWYVLKESAKFEIQIHEQAMFKMQSIELIDFVRVGWSFFSPRVVRKLQEIDPVFVRKAKKMYSYLRIELRKNAENQSWSIRTENYTDPPIGDEIQSVYTKYYPFKS